MTKSQKLEEKIIDKTQLAQHYYEGCKPKSDFKVGVEIEKIGINSKNYKAVSYNGLKGILEFLKQYKSLNNGKFIHEDDFILGIDADFGNITLEPGAQIEISLNPRETIHDLAKEINFYNKTTALLAQDFDIHWLGYGLQPLSTYKDIELLPKKRYDIMTRYLPSHGEHSLVMMRETAGIQVAFDYESEQDASEKLRLSLGVAPIVNAMFSNSPIRNGKLTEYKSFRSNGWLATDEARCGLISKKIFEADFGFDDYADVLLNLPMIFLTKNNEWFNMKGLTFKEYIQNGYEGHKATIEDWHLHKSSFFPDTRLNSYIEIRNCDCQSPDYIMAVPALWKGIIYDNDALSAAWELVKDFSWEERLELGSLVPKYALETRVNNIIVADIAKELVDIADYSLKKMRNLNENNQDESVYLEKFKELIYQKQSPADVIIHNWNNGWNKDLSKLIEHVRLD